MPPCANAAGSGAATLTQNGCALSIAVPGLGTFTGDVVGNSQTRNFQIAFDPQAPGSPTCTGSGAAGLDPFTASQMRFTFGDNTADCCRHGALTLRR